MSDPSPTPLELAGRCLPGLELGTLRVEPLGGGGNNRLYRLRGPGRDLVLKHYFRHPAQPRDRLGTEFAFLQYAWERGLRDLPQPLGRDDQDGAGLYGFVAGAPLVAAEVGPPEVGEALAFLAALNGPQRASAHHLGAAAEACFSVEAHLAVVEGRVERLLRAVPQDALGAEAARFVAQELAPAWREVQGRVRAALGPTPPRWALELSPQDRLLSPSDFGFHNALRRPDGRLAFLDFEYAGWDDPAKLICDFFLQPARPAPPAAAEAFAAGVAALVEDMDGARDRAELLRPVAGVKWCCILLNHFSTVDLARRVFAAADAPDRRAGQLGAARRLLHDLMT